MDVALLGLRQVVRHRLGLQCEIHHARHNDSGRRAKPEAGRLVDPLAVERVVDREPQPLVVPRRFGVPLLGELYPEDRGVLGRDDLHARVVFDPFRIDAVDISTGALDTSIVIRTYLVIGRDVYFQVGGGIVADSDPAQEYRETLDKARGLIAALEP